MSLETSNFNSPQEQPEKGPAKRAFLREQIHLPLEKRSPEFRALVDAEQEDLIRFIEQRKRIRSGEEAEPEESPEAERQHTFDRYMEQLELGEDMLKGKRVMDLGFGTGEFIQHLLSAGITSEAYGIDVHPFRDFKDDGFEGHFFTQSSEEDLPVNNLDYIVAIRSVSHGGQGEDGNVMNVDRVLEKSLAALKEGGEMRIYPVDESAKGNLDTERVHSVQEWEASLAAMSEKYGLTYEIDPINIFVGQLTKDVTLQSVLIIRKQSEK